MTVTYLPYTESIHSNETRGNFEYIESYAVFTTNPPPTVAGSRASGAALVSLLAVLVGYGLIIDGTTT